MAAPPKKVLVAAGQALHDIERAAQHRIAVGKPKLHWAALIAREKDMIKDIPENLARAMARSSVEVIKGHRTFAGPDSVRVGDRTLRAGHIVIAAGSKPRPLPIPGAKHTVTSDDMLREGRRPESIIFIGAARSRSSSAMSTHAPGARSPSWRPSRNYCLRWMPMQSLDFRRRASALGCRSAQALESSESRRPANGSASSLCTRAPKRL